MKILGIVWRVIANILTISIVLGIFSVTSNQFETVVLSVLIFIYLSIWGFMTSWGMYQLKFSEALDSEFKAIKKHLNIPDNSNETVKRRIAMISFPELSSEENEYEKEAQIEREKIKKDMTIKFYINSGFQTIIYIITLYHLLTALSVI